MKNKKLLLILISGILLFMCMIIFYFVKKTNGHLYVTKTFYTLKDNIVYLKRVIVEDGKVTNIKELPTKIDPKTWILDICNNKTIKNKAIKKILLKNSRKYVCSYGLYAIDDKYVYYFWKKYKGIDLKTFQPLSESFSIDKNWIYFYGKHIKGTEKINYDNMLYYLIADWQSHIISNKDSFIWKMYVYHWGAIYSNLKNRINKNGEVSYEQMYEEVQKWNWVDYLSEEDKKQISKAKENWFNIMNVLPTYNDGTVYAIFYKVY